MAFRLSSGSSCTSIDEAPGRRVAARCWRSVHSSDSCASPPESNTPTTVQVEPRKCSCSPTATPSNCCVACRPAMSSLRPDWNSRPSTSFTSGRIASPAGSTPRSATLSLACSLPSPFFSSVITMISPDASGRPSASCLMPGSELTSGSTSGPMPDDSSDSTPADSSSARSLVPVPFSVRSKPRLIDSMPISTATTQPMPTTITSEVPGRLPMLRKFISVMAKMVCMARSSVPPASTMDRRSARSWPAADQQRQHQHGAAANSHTSALAFIGGSPAAWPSPSSRRPTNVPAIPPSTQEQTRQAEHAPVGEADGLSTASSGMRSCTAWLMVLPVSVNMAKNTAPGSSTDRLEVADLAHEVQRSPSRSASWSHPASSRTSHRWCCRSCRRRPGSGCAPR